MIIIYNEIDGNSETYFFTHECIEVSFSSFRYFDTSPEVGLVLYNLNDEPLITIINTKLVNRFQLRFEHLRQKV